MPSMQIEPKPTEKLATPVESTSTGSDFAREAQGKSAGIFAELWGMIRENKKWWLLPVIAAVLIIGVLVMASSGVLAPLIYTLF